jgi:hypothetical protein
MENGHSWSAGKPSDWETRQHVIELKQRNEELKGLEKQVLEIRLRIGKLCHIDIDSYKERTEFFLKFWMMFRLEKKVQETAKEAKKDASEESQSNKDATVLMDMIIFFVLGGLDYDVYDDFLDFIKKCYANGCLFLVALMVARKDLYKGLRWNDGGVNKADISSVIKYNRMKVKVANAVAVESGAKAVVEKEVADEAGDGLTKLIFAFYDRRGESKESYEVLSYTNDIITLWRPLRELKRCFVRHDNKWGRFFLNCYSLLIQYS